MRYMFIAPDITAPTLDTVRESVSISFQKVERFLQSIGQKNVTIRISIQRSGRLFEIHVELIDYPKEKPFIKLQEEDLRAGISKAAKKIKSVITNKKYKVHVN